MARIISSLENAGSSRPSGSSHSLQVDRRMVERLHAEMARRTVAIAGAIEKRKGAEKISS
jgi:hypothetical protein